MKAAVYYQNGDPSVLRYEDVPDPVCHPKGVVIRVEAVSVEGGDTLNRLRGALATTPHIVGYQAAGEIIEVGAEVTHLKVGDRVATVDGYGSHAELRPVPARNCWPSAPHMNACSGAASSNRARSRSFRRAQAASVSPRSSWRNKRARP